MGTDQSDESMGIEARPIQWVLASRGSRLIAVFIDMVIMMVINVPLIWVVRTAFSWVEALSPVPHALVMGLLNLMIFGCVNAKFLIESGQTIGKKIVGIRIVDLNNQLLSLEKLLIYRYGVWWLIIGIPFVGSSLVMLDVLFIFSPAKRCLHDVLAGSKVVREVPNISEQHYLGDVYSETIEPGAEPEMHWAAKACIWLFVMGIGAVYGVTGYKFFETLLSNPGQGKSGLMSISFLVGLPICISIIAVGLIQQHKKISFYQALVVSGVPILLSVFLAGTLLREGFICILMALPLFLIAGAIGAFLIWMLSPSDKKEKDRSLRMLSVFSFVPFVLGAVEQRIETADSIQKIERSIHIQADPDRVWQHINFPLNIQPSELKEGFAYRIGVPYPVEARTLEPKVGGKRHLIWQRGVSFEEEITGWQEKRYIAWRYIFKSESFPTGSLDDHIVIGGRYFNLEDTSYTLIPEPGGTHLKVKVTFKVNTHFNWYAGAWAKYLITDTAETILKFYKHRSEAA